MIKHFVLIFLAALCLRVAISSIGPVLEVIVFELSLPRVLASLIVTIPVACMGVCALLAKPLSMRFGLERTIAFCLLLLALAILIRTSTQNFYLLAFGSILVGTSIAISGPLISGYIKRHLHGKTAKGMMLYSLGISISGLLGTFTTLPLMQYASLGWSQVLQFWAYPILVIGLIWMLFFMRQSQVIASDIPVNLPWANKRAWALLIAFGLQSSTFYSLLSWSMPYLSSYGFSELRANYYLNLYMCVAPVGSICFPLLLAKYNRQLVIFSCGMLTILSLLSLAINPHFMTFVVMFILGITANGGMFILILSLPFYEVEDANAVASWTAMILSLGYIISAIIPTLFGLLKDITGSYHGIMWGLFVNGILMVLILWFLTSVRSKHAANTNI